MKISVFVKNTVVLCLTSVILRIAGVLFRIYLADRIGSEGMGVYQLIFSVYILASTFAMSGICTAVTRLVSENLDRGRLAVKSVMRAAAVLTLIAAAVSSAAVFFGAEFIGVRLLCDARTVPALKILCFSLPFMGLSSCIRGYFIACRKTLSPSLTGLAEQAVRIGVVLFCLSKGISRGIAYSAAAVLLGDTTAETVSFLISWVLYRRDLRKMHGSDRISGVFRKILRIALPLSAAAYMSTALHTAENLLIPSRLHNADTRGIAGGGTRQPVKGEKDGRKGGRHHAAAVTARGVCVFIFRLRHRRHSLRRQRRWIHIARAVTDSAVYVP